MKDICKIKFTLFMLLRDLIIAKFETQQKTAELIN